MHKYDEDFIKNMPKYIVEQYNIDMNVNKQSIETAQSTMVDRIHRYAESVARMRIKEGQEIIPQ